MSKETVKKVNKVWKGFLFALATFVGFGALIYNSAHFFTTGWILMFAFTSELLNEEDYAIN